VAAAEVAVAAAAAAAAAAAPLLALQVQQGLPPPGCAAPCAGVPICAWVPLTHPQACSGPAVDLLLLLLLLLLLVVVVVVGELMLTPSLLARLVMALQQQLHPRTSDCCSCRLVRLLSDAIAGVAAGARQTPAASALLLAVLAAPTAAGHAPAAAGQLQ
jgi:hypothetical protein